MLRVLQRDYWPTFAPYEAAVWHRGIISPLCVYDHDD